MTADLGKYPFALPYGSVLAGQYITGRVLGQGGFGITSLAWDDRLKTRVAIKEFLPDTMAVRAAGSPQITVYTGQRQENFQYGMERFLDEAKVLAKFQGDPRIVGVQSYFEENGTAYFVMDYVEGTSLKAYIQSRGGKLPWEEAMGLLTPVMDALDAVHREGIIHRDVTPDNIFLTSGGGVKLLDFGSARYSLGDRSRSLDVVLKAGYAPKEQYTRRGRQGPYTDVYSLAACLYAAITGYLPPESLDRVDEDELVLPSTRGIRLPQAVEDVLLKGLEVQPADRYQTMGEFRQALDAARTPAEAPVPPPPEPEPEKETAPESTAPAEKAVKPVEGKTERKADRGLPRAAKWSLLAAGFCAVLLIGLAVGGVFTRPTDSGSAAPVGNMAEPETLADHPDGTPEETAGSEALVVVTLTASDVQELADLHGKLIGISATYKGPAGVHPEAYEEASALYGDENLLLVDAGDAGVMDYLRSGVCDAAIMDARDARELADGSTDVRILDSEWTAEAARQGMEAGPADTNTDPEPVQEPTPVTEPVPVQEPAPDTGAVQPVQEPGDSWITDREYSFTLRYLVMVEDTSGVLTHKTAADGETSTVLAGRLGLAASQGRLILLTKYGEKDSLLTLKEGKPKSQELHGTYTGGWSDDRPEGQGTFTIRTESPYGGVWEGDWEDGAMTYGVCRYTNGDRYEGNLDRGSPTGYGVMRYQNGDCYEGQWQYGLWHGEGTVTYADGSTASDTWYRGRDAEAVKLIEEAIQALEAEATAGEAEDAQSPEDSVSDNIEESFKYFS